MMTPALWGELRPRLEDAGRSLPDRCCIQGSGSKAAFLPPMPHGLEEWRPPAGESPLVFHSPEDQVAGFWAGATVADAQAALARAGQTLPLPATGIPMLDGFPGTMGGLAAMNLPHALWGQLGSIKDSVLGMAVLRHDRTPAKCGSSAVKSVAGYDIHRLMCGSRGILGPILMLWLRVLPLGALPTVQAEVRKAGNGPLWIQRTLPAEYNLAVRRSPDVLACCPVASLIWHGSPPLRVEQDWVVGPAGSLDPQGAPAALRARVKASFDPDSRFNPHLTV